MLIARAAGGWWLATSSGLLQLDADLVQVHAQAFTSPITRVPEAADGTLWLGADPLGLVRIDADATAVLGRVDGLPNARVASMLRDHEGNLWAGTNGGLGAAERRTVQCDHRAPGVSPTPLCAPCCSAPTTALWSVAPGGWTCCAQAACSIRARSGRRNWPG
ncbi:MAG: hypothetical protein IPO66_20165 [Rhodanobacteraceae bacterium]|nr:hypothetical protein [Rhodanobacteraceae bacterium]